MAKDAYSKRVKRPKCRWWLGRFGHVGPFKNMAGTTRMWCTNCNRIL